MSEQLTLTLDNESRCTSQLEAHTTRHEIEGDSKEERKPEFGDYSGNFVWFLFSVWGIPLTFFSITGRRIVG